MAEDIKVHVHLQSGDVHPIEAPADLRTEEFVREVVSGLNLPRTDAEGHQVSWIVDNKDTGRTLDFQKTLAEEGVRAGHHLHMRRQVTAGAGKSGF